MADYTDGIKLGNLLLEGAVIALSIELICRNLYKPKQRGWTIRILKIAMSITMVAKSVLFSMFLLRDIGNYRCQIIARTGDACYHLSCVFGATILLLRVKVIVPIHFKMHFLILHAFFIALRISVGVADVITVRVWPDNITDQCHYKDMHQVGILYTITDLVIDVYVSLTVSYVLLHHIRKLHLANIRGNRSLYISVLLANVFRTVILSILNIISTIYFFTSNSNTSAFLFLWPVANLLFVILIGYDTDIADSIRYLHQLFPHNPQSDIQVNNSPRHPNVQRNIPSTTTTLNTNINIETANRSSTISQSGPPQFIHNEKGSIKTLSADEATDIESANSVDIGHNNTMKTVQ